MVHPYEVCWANPASIKYGSGKTFIPPSNRGKVVGGDWDIEDPIREVSKCDWMISLRERIMGGMSWEQTSIYKMVLESIDTKGKGLKHTSISSFHERLERFETLFKKIEKRGYLVNPSNIDISINIGRSGELRFNDGIHRLCIAQLLELDTIPVQIVVRHPEWTKFKNGLIQFSKSHRGRFYHPFTHPDLQRIPVAHDDSRFYMIKDNLTLKGGRLLDIGAYLGYFCFMFEDAGFDCYAVEQEQPLVDFMKTLKKAEYKQFKIIGKSIFEIENTQFDIVLALNVFHHFLKKKSTFDQLRKLLSRLEVKEMFFQAHDPKEKQMKNAYTNFSPEDFTEFIIENSCLNERRKVGNTKDGRTLFKLWR